MKKILLILLILLPFGVYSQTDREILLELVKQQTETNKQITELAKQQAITATKVDGMDKRFDSVDKRIDMQSNLMMGMMAFIAALVGAIIWDRRAANSPLETKKKDLKLENEVLAKEINLLKERETKSEFLLKKLLEKFPDLANLA